VTDHSKAGDAPAKESTMQSTAEAQPDTRVSAPIVMRDHRASSALAERLHGGAVDTSPPAVIARLMQMGVSPVELKGMLEIQERWEGNEAKKAFNKAFAAFKRENVSIFKGTEIKDGPLKGKFHADLEDFTSAVTEPLAKHGLTISWKTTKDEKDWMEVTCFLKHEGGHAETETMGGAPDTGPGRNAIQARGSTRTYLQRYTGFAILGMAAKGADDDGAGGRHDGGDAKTEKKAGLPAYPATEFVKNLPTWQKLILEGGKDPESIIAKVETKALLNESQKATLRNTGKPRAGSAS
jgi:hypothetical protein